MIVFVDNISHAAFELFGCDFRVESGQQAQRFWLLRSLKRCWIGELMVTAAQDLPVSLWGRWSAAVQSSLVSSS